LQISPVITINVYRQLRFRTGSDVATVPFGQTNGCVGVDGKLNDVMLLDGLGVMQRIVSNFAFLGFPTARTAPM
jgi:hypothetical protein